MERQDGLAIESPRHFYAWLPVKTRTYGCIRARMRVDTDRASLLLGDLLDDHREDASHRHNHSHDCQSAYCNQNLLVHRHGSPSRPRFQYFPFFECERERRCSRKYRSYAPRIGLRRRYRTRVSQDRDSGQILPSCWTAMDVCMDCP